jgi:hypothetical protein
MGSWVTVAYGVLFPFFDLDVDQGLLCAADMCSHLDGTILNSLKEPSVLFAILWHHLFMLERLQGIYFGRLTGWNVGGNEGHCHDKRGDCDNCQRVTGRDAIE